MENYIAVTCGNQTARESTAFNSFGKQVLMNLQTTTPKRQGFFPATKAELPENGSTIYAFAQCTETITQNGCLNCLNSGYNNMLTCFPNSDGKVFASGCFMRYSTTSFCPDNYQTIEVAPLLGKQKSCIFFFAPSSSTASSSSARFIPDTVLGCSFFLVPLEFNSSFSFHISDPSLDLFPSDFNAYSPVELITVTPQDVSTQATSLVLEPKSFKEASYDPLWQQVMNEKLQALEKIHTWDLIDLPSGKTLIGCRWVYKNKTHFDGSLKQCSDDTGVQELKIYLGQQFEMKDLGNLNYFLGLEAQTRKGTSIGGVVGGVAFLLILFALFAWIRRSKTPRGDKIIGASKLDGLVTYSYEDLKFATNNFSEENKLGQGGFGVVYKGALKNGKVVAIKKLNFRQFTRMEEDFESEVKLISNVHNLNLVQLLGCCNKGKHRILVYEYMKNNSLDKFLFVYVAYLSEDAWH
ncbi:uncharacterized protein LOC129302579 [Prosopis cineraria]|uniref:uncharacterized protein LOC129302579 n=1 Tax=Prosopis cineraria TaxID=364024 RepID=UPI00240EAB92|nr:uncharacterized protein LOC129302579 [Prosopis cineraria]